MIKRLLTSTAVALVLTLPALAQTSTTTTTDTQSQSTTVPSTSQSGSSADTSQSATQPEESTTDSTAPSNDSSSAGQAAAADEAIIDEQQPGQVRADKVIGAKVTNPGGEKVGDVRDILLDEQGKVVGVILSVGGFLGIGDKHVAVNWSDIKLEGEGDKVVVNMSKDQIENAPSFKTAEDMKRTQQAETPSAGSTMTGNTGATAGSSTNGSATSGSNTTQ